MTNEMANARVANGTLADLRRRLFGADAERRGAEPSAPMPRPFGFNSLSLAQSVHM
jgi:hypothetical protein